MAAPQIGESLRVVVVEYTDDEREDARPKKYVLVNPEIVRESEETVTDLEGCLSVPVWRERLSDLRRLPCKQRTVSANP